MTNNVRNLQNNKMRKDAIASVILQNSAEIKRKGLKYMKQKVVSVNPNAQQEVKDLLNYFESIEGKTIILGQHTQTMEQEELHFIKEATGKLPALCGFELLAYSPNINFEESSEECLAEVRGAERTLQKAWEWAEKKGLLTFTWHWFSPMGGKDKAFYSEHTAYNAALAAQNGTEENKALTADMDYMAGLLKPFCDAHVPILWRPFHECDGTWFWWGRNGAEAVKKLYRMMFERFTYRYHLDNLIWVFNASDANFYPGDDVVDIISCDMYPEAHEHTDCRKELENLKKITSARKLYAIGEIGAIPDVSAVVEHGMEWIYYMTWSLDYGRTERFTTKEELRRAYDSPGAVTLARFPELY